MHHLYGIYENLRLKMLSETGTSTLRVMVQLLIFRRVLFKEMVQLLIVFKEKSFFQIQRQKRYFKEIVQNVDFGHNE